MIEDELRGLLADRAGEAPDNPARHAQVRSRIRTIRRRRATGAALGLVLVALAGLMLTRVPGRPDALPTGVPAPPYFDTRGVMTVPGYSPLALATELRGPFDRYLPAEPGNFRYLVVARCTQPGQLTFRHLTEGPSLTVECSRPVGGHFEGAAAFDAAAAEALLAERTPPAADLSNVRLEPGAEGQVAGLLVSNDPDSLRPWSDPGSRPLAEGSATPGGTTVDITIPGYRGSRPDGTDALFLSVECVAGVRLTFSVPAGDLGTADCDPLAPNGLDRGMVTVPVIREELDRLGLRAGDRVPLTIRSTGRDTDQWRVYPIR